MTRIPTVSIIIPFYNNVPWLIEAIDSVFSQTFSDYEIIVINDGSPEDISEFLEKYGSQIIYRWKSNEGPGSARNLGIDIANGKYIAFLDSDDLWNDKKLEKQIQLMEQTNATWSHSNWGQFSNNESDILIKEYNSGIFGKIFPLSLLSINIATPSVIIRTSYLKTNKDIRFSEKMRFGQDYFLWLLISIDQPIFLVPEILTKARVRGGNAVKRSRAHLQVRAQIWENLKDHPSMIFYKKKYFVFIRLIYIICFYENRFVGWIENKNRLSSSNIEYLSKIIYTIPYSSFKFLHYIINHTLKYIPKRQ